MNKPGYIHYSSSPKASLQEVLNSLQPDQVAFLVDENTKPRCLPHLEVRSDDHIIEIQSGEKNKNLETCDHIWSKMTDFGFSRKSVLINVGGGVIGDMGGFAASTYKRGIRFVNFPTTLLAAVDANIGGKLGIDFRGFKNHIGVFQDPDAVIIWDGFLKSLPARELRSGYAEVIKHGLIYDKKYWDEVCSRTFPDLNWLEVIKRSVTIKSNVVTEDPRENGLRKILNFGHTIGHGVETWYLNNEKDLLHGEAIAIGMITEAFISFHMGLLSETELNAMTNYLVSTYGTVTIPDLSEVLPIMKQDKKNTASEISFSLINGIGSCLFDQSVNKDLLEKAFEYYRRLNK